MGSEALTTGGGRRALPVLLAAALVVAPFALSLATAGERTLFGVLAPDAMYYLAIAKNAARGFFLSFNQETLTNGFQPLWQYLLALAAWLLRPGPAALLWGTFWTCLALVALGVGAAVWGVQARFGPRVAWAMPFLLLPGAFALLFEPAIGHASLDPALQYGFSVWAFVNGVESGLGVAAFGLLLATLLANLVRRGPEASPEVIFSGWARVWLAVIVLARLDDVFLFAGVAAAVLLCGGSSPAQRVRQLVVIALPAAVLVLAYVGFNLVTTGVALPLSGLQKTQLALPENLALAASLLVDFRADVASRLLPMLVFLVTGAGAFGLGLRTLHTGEADLEPGERALVRWLVLPLSAYLLLKALFHFTSVLTWEQGWWYYSGQIFVFDFLVALALARLLAVGRRVFAPALALLILVTTLQVLDTGRRMNALYDSYAATFFVLWQDREALGRALQALDPEMKLIDNTDGLYAFMLDVPAASVTGLVFSEAEMEMAMREGVAVSLVKRGYDVLPVLTDDRWKGHYRALDRIRPRAKLLHEHERSGVRFYRLSNE